MASVDVNGVSILPGPVRSLALRLAQQHDRASNEAAADLDALLERGGATTIQGEQAAAVHAALQRWLEQTNADVLGAPLLELRDRLHDERSPGRP